MSFLRGWMTLALFLGTLQTAAPQADGGAHPFPARLAQTGRDRPGGPTPEIGKLLPGQGGQQAHFLEISTRGLPFMGSEEAKVTLIEFSDYQCFFCRAPRSASRSPHRQGVRRKRSGEVCLYRFPAGFPSRSIQSRPGSPLRRRSGQLLGHERSIVPPPRIPHRGDAARLRQQSESRQPGLAGLCRKRQARPKGQGWLECGQEGRSPGNPLLFLWVDGPGPAQHQGPKNADRGAPPLSRLQEVDRRPVGAVTLHFSPSRYHRPARNRRGVPCGRPIRESPGNHNAGNHKGCPYVGGYGVNHVRLAHPGDVRGRLCRPVQTIISRFVALRGEPQVLFQASWAPAPTTGRIIRE